ncbi:MAG TPA: HlyD family secretion protein [Candidatus Acidoferrum sp.]|nr:HlyD family secretion protein [Candidatus Acidoferrum sp.]
MSENPPPSAPAKNGNGARLARLNSPWFLWPATVVVAGLLYFGLLLLNAAFTRESTDDAFIEAHVVSIAPRVAGQVLAVPVLDNQFVHSNDLLAQIDPADYAVKLAQKQAAAESQNANYGTVLAAYELMGKKVATAEASARKAKADAEASAATAKRAEADFERSQTLLKQNTVSQQEFDAAKAAKLSAQADLKSAEENAAEEASKVEEAQSQLEAAGAEAGMALSQWKEAQTNVIAAQLDLSYTKLLAPCDGRVTRKSVEPGNYVDVGQMLMSIVPAEVWVVANFKESQLKHMKPGQRAMVTIDALDESFAAHVDSIQAGTGARFSLLPPENATGNYVKVVQRVPVKIVFDEPLPPDRTIGPGLSVVPEVQVVAFRVPEWVMVLVALMLAGAAAAGFRRVLKRKLGVS